MQKQFTIALMKSVVRQWPSDCWKEGGGGGVWLDSGSLWLLGQRATLSSVHCCLPRVSVDKTGHQAQLAKVCCSSTTCLVSVKTVLVLKVTDMKRSLGLCLLVCFGMLDLGELHRDRSVDLLCTESHWCCSPFQRGRQEGFSVKDD